MRYLLILLILVFVPKHKKEIIVVSKPIPIETHITHFPKIYKKIREHEGYYSNHPSDKGGETYAGITRRYNPKWYGWKYVRSHKRNEIIPEAEYWVLDHYLDIWVDEGYDTIKDYNVALALFDFRVHSSPKTVNKKLNRVLDTMGICSVNDADPTEFVLRLKIERILLYNYLVKNDSTQLVFYRGWVKRLAV